MEELIAKFVSHWSHFLTTKEIEHGDSGSSIARAIADTIAADTPLPSRSQVEAFERHLRLYIKGQVEECQSHQQDIDVRLETDYHPDQPLMEACQCAAIAQPMLAFPWKHRTFLTKHGIFSWPMMRPQDIIAISDDCRYVLYTPESDKNDWDIRDKERHAFRQKGLFHVGAYTCVEDLVVIAQETADLDIPGMAHRVVVEPEALVSLGLQPSHHQMNRHYEQWRKTHPR